MRAGALLAVALLVAALSTAAAEEKIITKSYDETFQVGEGASIYVSHGDGDVTVTPWDESEIRVVVHYDATIDMKGLWKQTDFEVTFEQNGDALRVIGRVPDVTGFGWVRRTTRAYTYEIWAPASTELELKGDDGDVGVSGWRESINCSLDDGDIRLADVNCGHIDVSIEDGDTHLSGVQAVVRVSGDDGRIEIDDWTGPRAHIAVADGDVRISGGSGEVHVTLDDGDLRIERFDGGSVSAMGEDGDMHVELMTPGSVDVELATDDGDVDLRLHPDVSAMLAIAMDDGDVNISHPGLSSVEKMRHRFTGTLGEGDGTVDIRTADGDIFVREAE